MCLFGCFEVFHDIFLASTYFLFQRADDAWASVEISSPWAMTFVSLESVSDSCYKPVAYKYKPGKLQSCFNVVVLLHKSLKSKWLFAFARLRAHRFRVQAVNQALAGLTVPRLQSVQMVFKHLGPRGLGVALGPTAQGQAIAPGCIPDRTTTAEEGAPEWVGFFTTCGWYFFGIVSFSTL